MSIYVVLEGNLSRGFECYGPFNSTKEATVWAKENRFFNDDEWHVMPVLRSDPEQE